MKAHYDDPSFFYDQYWRGREYEHLSEVMAISRLLEDSRFSSASDIGGGYGRLTGFLAPYSKVVNLVEPSVKQLALAGNYLKGFRQIKMIRGTTQKTGLSPNSQDLILVVRVMHHLPDPNRSFHEFNRILKPGGLLILEFANSFNFKSRIHSFLTGQPILPAPIDRRSYKSIRHHTIEFVNHYPDTVFKDLSRHGFTIQQLLSVSNFRSPFLKKFIPMKILLYFENLVQSPLSRFYFGPSIFVLARKN